MGCKQSEGLLIYSITTNGSDMVTPDASLVSSTCLEIDTMPGIEAAILWV